jgi:O-Glycosyl hydrolase
MTERAPREPLLISSDERAVWRQSKPRLAAEHPTIDLEWTGARHQRMEGFGGCVNELGWLALKSTSEEARQEVLKALFDKTGDGLRLELNRIPIGATDYSVNWYSCNDNEGDYAMEKFSLDRDRQHLLPYVKAAQEIQPDMQWFASPWSPPTWMKHPQTYNYGKLVPTEQNLQAYALYLLKFAEAYAQEGVRIAQLHFQNEPVTHHRFPSCVWTGEEMRDFLKRHLGPLFKEKQPEIELWLGTLNTDSYDSYAGIVLNDPEAKAYVSGVGYQWAGKQAIQRTHVAFPEMRLMQTENECGDGKNTWEYAHYIFGLLWHYLNNGVESYVYWNMVLPKGGECTWGGYQNSLVNVDLDNGEVAWNPEFYLFKHVCRFVGKGSDRLSLRGGWSGNAIAFENAEGRKAFIVHNPHDEPRTIAIACEGAVYEMPMTAKSFHTLVI